MDYDAIILKVIHPEEIIAGKKITFSHLKEAAVRAHLECLKKELNSLHPGQSGASTVLRMVRQLEADIEEVRKS
jgi:hypothetical protein